MNKNQLDRLQKVAELYRKALLPKANFPKGKLIWHHQKDSGSKMKVTQASSCKKAFEEIESGLCIPVTMKEHSGIHPSTKSQKWGPCNYNKNAKVPKFDKVKFRKVVDLVMSKRTIKEVKEIHDFQ